MTGRIARAGTVYLVGAGPGDARLLTVRGRELLDDCDAVVHDALVDRSTIAAAGAGGRPAEVHFTGKRGGDPASARQVDISGLLIDLARAGKSVVRLKGGDPFVFGRGSEEAQALAAAGVRFEVVPGVTAGIAAPAYAGIPVTHRGVATSVTFVTGHEDPAKPDTQTNWGALAQVAAAGGTIVLYMGGTRLGEIARALIGGGLPGATPAAAIQSGTYNTQRTVIAPLETIAAVVAAHAMVAPIVAVVGEVVALREAIRWFDRPDWRPLLGHRILVTRATAQAGALADRLREAGAAVTAMPATRIEALDAAPLLAALARLRDYDHIVFTSQNAVAIVWDAMRCLGQDARALAGISVSAVGPATATALLACGVAADVTPPPERFVADGLLDALERRGGIAGSRVLYPAAAGARAALPDGLRALGASVEVIPIYRSIPDGRDAGALSAELAADQIDLVTFTSASAVEAYLDLVGPALARRAPAVAIGPITRDAARRAGIDVVAQAAVATLDSLVEAVVSVIAAPAPDAPA